MIVNVIEPDHGRVLDPACGSGGMFVQSAHFVGRLHQSPTERLTFYGMEKNPTTIRLAKMNLAVHGLEGDIQKAITYYDDPHERLGQADFVFFSQASSAGREEACLAARRPVTSGSPLPKLVAGLEQIKPPPESGRARGPGLQAGRGSCC